MNRILVANRGEIAVRILRTARSLGYETVALFSDADAEAPHVDLADQAVRIGPAPAADSYLNPQKILDAARRTNADAIHPGYGFLSENADFARQVVDAGLVWIGPSPESMEIMGNKARAKQSVAAINVPLIPGYAGDDQSEAAFTKAADEIGYPVMIKAANGGGGRGMRLVTSRDDLLDAVARAKSESVQAFGSDELLLEKAIINARHIEFQIFGDCHGNIVHLGERDCSIQRRHQKVIEESPSPAVSDALREQMGQAAVAVAQSVNYENAGTVEFLLSEDGDFYFLEMNTRLQVEHPVTELVTGLDLVAWQLLVADGQPLPLKQADIELFGHAIEARLYAESPENDFLPSIGTVRLWRPPAGEGIRVDAGLHSGTVITPFYDALIAKIIAFGDDREIARRRWHRALRETVVLGVDTNRRFLLETTARPDFVSGDATTAFIQNCGTAPPRGTTPEFRAIAAAVMYRHTCSGHTESRGWSARPTTYCFAGDDSSLTRVQADPQSADSLKVDVADRSFDIRIESFECSRCRFELDGVMDTAWFAFEDDTLLMQCGDDVQSFTDTLLAPAAAADSRSSGRILAPMPGSVLSISVAAGDPVQKGTPLLILEAMKMEQTISAAGDGTVAEVLVRPGQQMTPNELMIVITPDEGQQQ